MSRRDPVQRLTEPGTQPRDIVDWQPRSAVGRLLRILAPGLSWALVFGLSVLLVWLCVDGLAQHLGGGAQRLLAGVSLAGVVVLCGMIAVGSAAPLTRGPSVGWLLSEDARYAQVARIGLIGCGAAVLGVQLVASEFAFVTNPLILGFVGLSVIPAVSLVVYIQRTDVTSPDPLGLLVAVYLLGLVLANLAAISNAAVTSAGLITAAGEQITRPVAVSLFFLVVVAPVEEVIKLLAGGLYTYRSEAFDAVAAGAVYGAVAGLGFATIENAIFITEQVIGASSPASALSDGSSITVGRAFAGPGHVIWSGIAGYYLGLARFNGRFGTMLVCKGLLIAVLLHGVYNISVSFLVAPVASMTAFSTISIFIMFAVVYHGLCFGFLLYKLLRYRDAHFDAHNGTHIESELAEFDP